MKSGTVRHYLSVYMAPPDAVALANIRHDHCAALWRDDGERVEIVRYWEFERITGMKHHRLPLNDLSSARQFLDSLLAEEGLDLGRLDAVWGTPWLETDDSYTSLADGTDLPIHSLSHLFAALLVDWQAFRDETIVAMALDLAPDWTLDKARTPMSYAGCVSVRGKTSVFPVESPGSFWFVARDRFGLEEGTLMALASATTCTLPFESEFRARLAEIELWNPAVGPSQRAIDELIGAAERALRAPGGEAACSYDHRFDFTDNLRSAVMKVIDTASTDVVERNLARVQASHDVDFTQSFLALGGGYALNCPNNTTVLDQYGFRGFLAHPCVNDGGQAFGIGLMALHARGASTAKAFRLPHAFLGRTGLHLDRALERFAPFIKSTQPYDLDEVLDDIARSPVAWVDGAAEVGPRALGHRSILGDPTNPDTKKVLNEVKQRQWWRPVAPMILAEEAGDWFETTRPSPFMLEAVVCRLERRHQVPAALHLDGTARIQTIAADEDPLLHELLRRQQRRTGVPILCNTSLNDKGEPIIDDAEQALNFCIRKGLTVAYVGGHRIELAEHAAPRPAEQTERDRGLFMELAENWPQAWRSVTERGIPVEAVFLAGWIPDVRIRLHEAVGAPARVPRLARLIDHLVRDMSDDQRSVLNNFIDVFGPTGTPLTQGYATLEATM